MKKLIFVFAALVLLVGFNLAVNGSALHAQETDSAGPEPLIDTYEMMDLMFDPRYEQLKDAVEVEPEARKGWRAIYISAYPLAEIFNLLLLRNDEEYMATPEWAELSIVTRDLTVKIVDAAREKDFAGVRTNYLAMVESCNACHERFQPDDPTEVSP